MFLQPGPQLWGEEFAEFSAGAAPRFLWLDTPGPPLCSRPAQPAPAASPTCTLTPAAATGRVYNPGGGSQRPGLPGQQPRPCPRPASLHPGLSIPFHSRGPPCSPAPVAGPPSAGEMACCVELEGCSLRATLDFLHPPLVLVGDDFENRVREEWGTQVVSTNTQLGDLGQQPASLSGSLLVNSYGEHPWNSQQGASRRGRFYLPHPRLQIKKQKHGPSRVASWLGCRPHTPRFWA